jgi:MFS family permease
VLAGFAIAFVLLGGGIDTVGIFVNAIAQGTGWASSALSLGVSVGAITAAAATPPVGIAVDRYGVRVPMTAGVALLAVGFAILLVMQAPWHFAAANVFLGAGFAACALLPLTVAITVSVRERTALALGIAAAGASAGALVLAPALQVAVETLGWRGAYAVLGSAVVVTPIPFLVFVLPKGPLRRDDRAEGGTPRLPGIRELRRSGAFPLIALMVLPGLVTFAVSVHVVPYLTGSGLSGRAAATALGTTIGVSAVGKICGGWIADRVGTLRTLRAVLLVATASFALLPWAQTLPALAGFIVLYGLTIGTYIALMPVLAREVLGAERFGTLFGVLQLTAMLAAAVGPVSAGLLFDATGRYTEAMMLWGGAMGSALLVAVAMRAAPAKAGV